MHNSMKSEVQEVCDSRTGGDFFSKKGRKFKTNNVT